MMITQTSSVDGCSHVVVRVKQYSSWKLASLCRYYMGIMEKKVETTIVYRDYIGIMEKAMETTIVYRDYIGIMENKMETTIYNHIISGPCRSC